ncbi:hypothetical protein GCM10010525_25960 [Glutamicibacter bergerei]
MEEQPIKSGREIWLDDAAATTGKPKGATARNDGAVPDPWLRCPAHSLADNEEEL